MSKIESILKNYIGFKELQDSSQAKRFVISLGLLDSLEITVSKEFTNEVRYRYCKFPDPIKFYYTTIPYDTIEDFENDLKRMGIKIPERI